MPVMRFRQASIQLFTDPGEDSLAPGVKIVEFLIRRLG
jgi:hypothetical protein